MCRVWRDEGESKPFEQIIINNTWSFLLTSLGLNWSKLYERSLFSSKSRCICLHHHCQAIHGIQLYTLWRSISTNIEVFKVLLSIHQPSPLEPHTHAVRWTNKKYIIDDDTVTFISDLSCLVWVFWGLHKVCSQGRDSIRENSQLTKF